MISLQKTSALIGLLCLVACGHPDDSAAPLYRINANPTEADIALALKKPMGILINLTTNRATIYRSGIAVDQWNVATGDVTGTSHDGKPQFTPEGLYSAHRLVRCPTWQPADPKWPDGRVAKTEEERQLIFKTYPETYGPCGANNPLGGYVLWFWGAFGVHGNSNEAILNRPDPEKRRVSGGCVRNPNVKIRWTVHEIFNAYPGKLVDFAKKLEASEVGVPPSQPLSVDIENLGIQVAIVKRPSDPTLPFPPRMVTAWQP